LILSSDLYQKLFALAATQWRGAPERQFLDASQARDRSAVEKLQSARRLLHLA
jgi:hypothetical protein